MTAETPRQLRVGRFAGLFAWVLCIVGVLFPAPRAVADIAAIKVTITWDASNPTNKVLLMWDTVPTRLYSVLTTTALDQPWQPLPGGTVVASSNRAEFRTGGSDTARFYRIVKEDTDPPEIQQLVPCEGAVGVECQVPLRIWLEDETGIDTNSITLIVGTNAAVSLADGRLAFAGGLLTYTPGTNEVLGCRGQWVTNQLVVADTLGHRCTNCWCFRVELFERLLPTPPRMLWSYPINADNSRSAMTNFVSIMKRKGYDLLGYRTISWDAGWSHSNRVDGFLVANSNRFPDGVQWVVQYLKTNGINPWLYMTIGRVGGAGQQGDSGSCGYLLQDTTNFVRWGVAGNKVSMDDEKCFRYGLDMNLGYAQAAQAALQAGPPCLIQQYSVKVYEPWMADVFPLVYLGGMSGLMAIDCTYDMTNYFAHLDGLTPYLPYNKPGHFIFNTTMIGGGAGSDAKTPAKERVVFGMAALTCQPYQPEFSSFTPHSADVFPRDWRLQEVMTNRTLIAIHDDPLVIAATPLPRTNDIQVWVKPLATGAKAVGFLNRNAVLTNNLPAAPASARTVSLPEIGLPVGPTTVWDVFDETPCAYITNSFTVTNLPAWLDLYRFDPGHTTPYILGTNYLVNHGWMGPIPRTYSKFINYTNTFSGWNASPDPWDSSVPVKRLNRMWGTPVTIYNSKVYTNGIGTRAWSRLTYWLGGKVDLFHTWWGLPSDQYYYDCMMKVSLDGVPVLTNTFPTYPSGPNEVSLWVTNATTITIEFTNRFGAPVQANLGDPAFVILPPAQGAGARTGSDAKTQ